MMEQLRRQSAQSKGLRRILGTENILFGLGKREKKLITKDLSRSLGLKKAAVDLEKNETIKKYKKN